MRFFDALLILAALVWLAGLVAQALSRRIQLQSDGLYEIRECLAYTEHGMTGLDIVAMTGSTVNRGSVYVQLQQLCADGFVEIAGTNYRGRKLYRLTQRGK